MRKCRSTSTTLQKIFSSNHEYADISGRPSPRDKLSALWRGVRRWCDVLTFADGNARECSNSAYKNISLHTLKEYIESPFRRSSMHMVESGKLPYLTV
jgi:hypothetical protein